MITSAKSAQDDDDDDEDFVIKKEPQSHLRGLSCVSLIVSTHCLHAVVVCNIQIAPLQVVYL